MKIDFENQIQALFGSPFQGQFNPLFLLISNIVNKLGSQQFLGTKTTETKKLLISDANKAFNKIVNEQKDRA